MSPLNENDVERILCRLQLVAEQAPEHLRPKRRQIVRGMRAALDAVAEGLSFDDLRDALVAEVMNAPLRPIAVSPTVVDIPDGATDLQRQILEGYNAGITTATMAGRLGCPREYVIETVQRAFTTAQATSDGQQ
ncbi:hypothetical protein [Pseudomonas sp. RW405]|uniref:hypothetical protein n=1 Tax=Pseudomonas sp. RW405 TaxID=2202652 RepID=UPI000D736D93|nr:hypothetical protein [Pseudomonas sp. RW405]PWY43394.1 hypothetical protein DK184_01040 [Pseudomonas sp. RW405]